MANHKSAKKMIKVRAKRTLINKMRKSKTRTAIRKLVDMIKSGDKENVILVFRSADSNLHKCVNKGVIYRNTAARKINHLNAKLKAFMTAKPKVNRVNIYSGVCIEFKWLKWWIKKHC
ncbi:30S ribosomal protein S20 [Wolbachia endosymbiont of Atemnus politus]|nr:30S ribosomal protein S20 [Wolbachia endosymbiont of Atemnus politus]NSX83689.1 30S ribosomal protein S20 [Wolbachia endosymbiont of Atemnus politus]